MTDYKEEQAMEVEALESIYMDEFTKLTDEPLSFQIRVVPNQDGLNNHVALILKCFIPETYPDVGPRIEVVVEKGLSDPQLKELKQVMAGHVEENLGMAMMYAVSEAVRDYLIENNREGNDGSEYQEMMRRMDIRKKKDDASDAADAVEAANNVQVKRNDHGTPVTVESFMAWRDKFEREMRVEKKESVKDETTAKLTGRMLWARGLAKDDEKLEDEADDDEEEDDGDYVEGEEEDDDDEDDDEGEDEE